MARRNSLPEETVHKLLSNPQRRRLLTFLSERRTATVDELSRHLASAEHRDNPTTDEEDARRRATVALVHTHIPLLEDHDVVEYNPERGEVALMDVFDELSHYIQTSADAATTSLLHRFVPGQ
ncbi:hypothetical protein ACLI4Q_17455 [Natrialbaceae archaeon A-CW1-1]